MTLVEVVAPNDMNEGFQFDAASEGRKFTATVPTGGVKAGEKIEVDMPSNDDGAVTVKDDVSPDGNFRHGLCSCCEVIFPCIVGCCCPLILLGQIMQRLKLNICGRPTESYQKTYLFCAIGSLLFYVIYVITTALEADPENPWSSVGIIFFSLWLFLALFSTRQFIRQKRKIEGSGFGDCICSFFCDCCSIIQIHRETHDEKEYPYEFTVTGLGSGAPECV